MSKKLPNSRVNHAVAEKPRATADMPAKGRTPTFHSSRAPAKPSAKKQINSDRRIARRTAILAAALEEFSCSGFANARLEDIAARAGVAKGTVYLYFRNKEGLFQELLREAATPILKAIATMGDAKGTLRARLDSIVDVLLTQAAQGGRGRIIWLVIAEGPRFPALADFHFREIVQPALAALRTALIIAERNGEPVSRGIADFPQLIVAPILMSVIWQVLFARLSPIDARRMIDIHFNAIFPAENRP